MHFTFSMRLLLPLLAATPGNYTYYLCAGNKILPYAKENITFIRHRGNMLRKRERTKLS